MLCANVLMIKQSMSHQGDVISCRVMDMHLGDRFGCRTSAGFDIDSMLDPACVRKLQTTTRGRADAHANRSAACQDVSFAFAT